MKLYVYRGRGASCILYTGSLWRPSTPAGCAIIPNYSFRIPVFTSIPFAIIFPYLNLMIIALSIFFPNFLPQTKERIANPLKKYALGIESSYIGQSAKHSPIFALGFPGERHHHYYQTFFYVTSIVCHSYKLFPIMNGEKIQVRHVI